MKKPQSPKPQSPKPQSREIISRQLRSIILDSGRTAYSIGREGGIDPGQIQRFLNEERDLKLDTLDRLAEVLDLRLIETARGRNRAKPARREAPRDCRRLGGPPEPLERRIDTRPAEECDEEPQP